MAIWDSEAACVGYLKIFRAMPKHWKIAEEASYILAPTCMSVVAYLLRGERIFGLVFTILAIVYWLGCTLAASRLVRGRSAERRGIPADFSHEIVRTPWGVYLWIFAILIVSAAFQICSDVSKGHPPHTALTSFFMNLSVFLVLLPTYLRSRIRRQMQSNDPVLPLA